MDEKTLLDEITEMAETFEALKKDAASVDKGNKAAGTRVRAVLMHTKKECDRLRKFVLSLRK